MSTLQETDVVADDPSENGPADGGEGVTARLHDGQDAEVLGGRDRDSGVLSRYIDVETAALRALVLTWKDLQQTRMSLNLRGADPRIVAEMKKLEDRASRQLSAGMRRHPLWPWLSQFPGLGGAHTALAISSIGDPRRFPGRRCTAGCYHPAVLPDAAEPHRGGGGLPSEEMRSNHPVADRGSVVRHVPESEAGSPCPTVGREGPCPGTLLPPRPGTGVRSVWHYLGLHVDDEGRSPRKRKGQRVSWDPIARASVLQPDGIADQIVKLRVPVYRDVYDLTKARLIEARGVAAQCAIATDDGAVLPGENEYQSGADGTEIEWQCASEDAPGLRPIQVHSIAKKVAAKRFIGDLLIEWKKIAYADGDCGAESDSGGAI